MGIKYFDTFFESDFKELVKSIKQLVNEVRELKETMQKEKK